MKQSHPAVSLGRLCWLLGITRQAYYQHHWRALDVSTEETLVLAQVRLLRKEHPVLGTRKLQVLLEAFLLEHHIKMGRDALFDLLSMHGLLVKKRKRKVLTTQSKHWLKKYPNLVGDWRPRSPMQLWVADITYVGTKAGFLYLSLLTDACSHKVVGYHIAPNPKAVHTLSALKMALHNHRSVNGLIHHSDRGIQYCSTNYVRLLQQHDIKISMSEPADPLQNALAERLNGIIKNEYLCHYPLATYQEAVTVLRQVIKRYNQQRPHQSIRMLTPEIVHQKQLNVNRSWSKKLPCKPISGLTKKL
jgi:putative transposase